MSTPRRSARLAPHASTAYQQQQRSSISAPVLPHTSHPSSTSTTSYPSPTNHSDMKTAHPAPSHFHSHPPLQVQSSFMPQNHYSHQNAPLPSPSAGDLDPFFGRPHSQPNPSSHPHHQNPPQASGFSLSSQQQQQQQQKQQHQQFPQQQQHMHHNSFSQQNTHPGQPGHMPHDFLAEAAKRAQMACLMRDLGDVSL